MYVYRFYSNLNSSKWRSFCPHSNCVSKRIIPGLTGHLLSLADRVRCIFRELYPVEINCLPTAVTRIVPKAIRIRAALVAELLLLIPRQVGAIFQNHTTGTAQLQRLKQFPGNSQKLPILKSIFTDNHARIGPHCITRRSTRVNSIFHLLL